MFRCLTGSLSVAQHMKWPFVTCDGVLFFKSIIHESALLCLDAEFNYIIRLKCSLNDAVYINLSKCYMRMSDNLK